ncbi:hypothetical protein H310_04947 [Aphanomyces invadans]|uniref:BSD domain-containing protein n=2 Tax=Aphanomyces invadans TaxID=157072 RepID=A0A024UB54_9STRA|nr:hypothetical protein H310_04947 [Aphanomyces invadans]ETW03499.1 hypothetical protein H310_04947 [Aphanomyces invadans]|eukprot:XP_008867728.1 hypothetical protein H310_04947 [Aphanomyces invadans]
MWIYQAAKQVQEKVQERATSIVAQVQDEAQLLLKTMSQAQTNPVDEIIFEELEDYKAFQEVFDLDLKTDDVASILQKDELVADLHTALVPEQLSYKEFWTRYYFRQFLQLRQEEEQAKRDEERRLKLQKERELRELRQKEAEEEAAQAERERAEQHAKEMDVQMWKDQVVALQEVIASLEKADVSNHQLLAEEYEVKLAQMTTQIDDARALGYEEGIAKSEQIVKSIRDSTRIELKEIEEYLLSLTVPTATMPSPPEFVSAALAQKIWALHGSATGRNDVDAAPLSQGVYAELESLRRENASLKASAEQAQEGLKELEVWKARAVKMKKLKDETDVAFKKHEDELKVSVAKAFQDGVAKGKDETAAQVASLQAKLKEKEADIDNLTKQVALAANLTSAPTVSPVEVAGPPTVEDSAAEISSDDVFNEERRGDDWGEWD